MILAINYANEKFRNTQKFNTKRALKFGADKAIEYTIDDISELYKKENRALFQYARGGGYWVWKPYIIREALNKVSEGDYVIYTDAGSAFVNKIDYLIKAMNNEQTDIMVFSITHPEKYYTKRDAFLLMDCDIPEIVNTPQICSGYIILRKTDLTCQFTEEFLHFIQDRRIVTDEENVMGKPNYEGFIENRHDQSVLSLLCKKRGVKPFRDPSQYGLNKTEFTDDINRRSNYPQIIDSHRNPNLHNVFQLKFRKWFG